MEDNLFLYNDYFNARFLFYCKNKAQGLFFLERSLQTEFISFFSFLASESAKKKVEFAVQGCNFRATLRSCFVLRSNFPTNLFHKPLVASTGRKFFREVLQEAAERLCYCGRHLPFGIQVRYFLSRILFCFFILHLCQTLASFRIC